MQSKPRLALDAGGVLFTHSSHHTAWKPGCLEALEELSKVYDIYVISFAGHQRGLETRNAIFQDAKNWLPDDHIHIVDDRKKKGPLCAELKIQMMVDDRLDVLNTVHQTTPHCKLYHFDVTGRTKNKPRYIQTVVDWENLMDTLL
jgi:5'(3')-deoxyribonucleotidase